MKRLTRTLTKRGRPYHPFICLRGHLPTFGLLGVVPLQTPACGLLRRHALPPQVRTRHRMRGRAAGDCGSRRFPPWGGGVAAGKGSLCRFTREPVARLCHHSGAAGPSRLMARECRLLVAVESSSGPCAGVHNAGPGPPPLTGPLWTWLMRPRR